MNISYEKTRKNIEMHFDKVTSFVNLVIYMAHLAFLAGYRINWNGGSVYVFWNTCVVVILLALVGMIVVSGVNWYIKYRLLKALDEEQQNMSIRKVA